MLGSKKAINSAAIIDDDEIEASLKAKMLDIRRQQFIGMQDILDDDDDFEDWIIFAYTSFIVVSGYFYVYFSHQS